MQFKPYFFFGRFASPFTTYRIEDGQVFVDTWLGGCTSIQLKDAKFEIPSAFNLFGVGTIKISTVRGNTLDRLDLKNIPDKQIVRDALEIAKNGAYPLSYHQESNQAKIVAAYTTGPENKFLSKGHGSEVRVVAFSPDGSLLASVGNDQTIKIWSLHDGQLQKTLRLNNSKLVFHELYPKQSYINFIDNGQKLIFGRDFNGFSPSSFIWDMQTNSVKRHASHVPLIFLDVLVKEVFGSIDDLDAVSPDRRAILHYLTGYNKKPPRYKISLFIQGKEKSIQSIYGDHSEPIMNPVAINNGGSLVAGKVSWYSNDGDHIIRIYDVKQGRLLRELNAKYPLDIIEMRRKKGISHHTYIHEQIIFNNNSSMLESTEMGVIHLFDIRSNSVNPCKRFDCDDYCLSIAFSNDDNTLAAGYSNGAIRIWNINTGEPIGP